MQAWGNLDTEARSQKTWTTTKLVSLMTKVLLEAQTVLSLSDSASGGEAPL